MTFQIFFNFGAHAKPVVLGVLHCQSESEVTSKLTRLEFRIVFDEVDGDLATSSGVVSFPEIDGFHACSTFHLEKECCE